ncbi:MAG: CBS domain-containing protein [Gammaproteobacteria bacterium]
MFDIGSLCSRPSVTCEVDRGIRSVADLMRNQHVGCVVVTDGGRPVGIVTDRDLVVGVLAAGVPPDSVRIGDVMTPEPATVRADASIGEAIALMHQKGVKRLPVVDGAGSLVGLVSADDLLEYFLVPFGDLASIMVRERDTEARRRPNRARETRA